MSDDIIKDFDKVSGKKHHRHKVSKGTKGVFGKFGKIFKGIFGKIKHLFKGGASRGFSAIFKVLSKLFKLLLILGLTIGSVCVKIASIPYGMKMSMNSKTNTMQVSASIVPQFSDIPKGLIFAAKAVAGLIMSTVFFLFRFFMTVLFGGVAGFCLISAHLNKMLWTTSRRIAWKTDKHDIADFPPLEQILPRPPIGLNKFKDVIILFAMLVRSFINWGLIFIGSIIAIIGGILFAFGAFLYCVGKIIQQAYSKLIDAVCGAMDLAFQGINTFMMTPALIPIFAWCLIIVGVGSISGWLLDMLDLLSWLADIFEFLSGIASVALATWGITFVFGKIKLIPNVAIKICAFAGMVIVTIVLYYSIWEAGGNVIDVVTQMFDLEYWKVMLERLGTFAIIFLVASVFIAFYLPIGFAIWAGGKFVLTFGLNIHPITTVYTHIIMATCTVSFNEVNVKNAADLAKYNAKKAEHQMLAQKVYRGLDKMNDHAKELHKVSESLDPSALLKRADAQRKTTE